MKLLTIEQAADELSVSEATIRRLVLAGKLKYVRVGKLMRFSQEDICQYIKEATTTGSEFKSTASSTDSPAKVLPMNRQKLSKQKLDKILSMSNLGKVVTH